MLLSPSFQVRVANASEFGVFPISVICLMSIISGMTVLASRCWPGCFEYCQELRHILFSLLYTVMWLAAEVSWDTMVQDTSTPVGVNVGIVALMFGVMFSVYMY